MKMEHIFDTEKEAEEAVGYLNDYGMFRNPGVTCFFQQGLRVWLRPEYASPTLGKVFETVVADMEAEKKGEADEAVCDSQR